jgi:hypothetical protein
MEIYPEQTRDGNVQQTLILMGEAYQFSGEFVKSNENLSLILEVFPLGCVSVETQIKTLKVVIINLQNLESFEEAIKYQNKLLKVAQAAEDQINIYQ